MKGKLSIAVDLDGVICEETKPYSKAKPIINASLFLMLLKERGNKIIIFTSRRERDRELTLKWLKKWEIPFDKLVMGKVKADYYVDDRAVNCLDKLCMKLGYGKRIN